MVARLRERGVCLRRRKEGAKDNKPTLGRGFVRQVQALQAQYKCTLGLHNANQCNDENADRTLQMGIISSDSLIAIRNLRLGLSPEILVSYPQRIQRCNE